MTKVTDERLGAFMRFQHDITERVIKGSLKSEQVEDVLRVLIGQKVKNDAIMELSTNKSFLIPDCGRTGFVRKEMPNLGVEILLKDWKKKFQVFTPETLVQSAFLRKDSLMEDILNFLTNSLSFNLDNICFTEQQVEMFCKKYLNYPVILEFMNLQSIHSCFFIKKDYYKPTTLDNILVIFARLTLNGLTISYYPTQVDLLWRKSLPSSPSHFFFPLKLDGVLISNLALSS